MPPPQEGSSFTSWYPLVSMSGSPIPFKKKINIWGGRMSRDVYINVLCLCVLLDV